MIFGKEKSFALALKTGVLTLHVHWCPGNKQIFGNELADRYAKEAAAEAAKLTNSLNTFTKKDASRKMKEQVIKKWKRAFHYPVM